MSVKVVYHPWNFNAVLEEQEFPLNDTNRLNVEDVEHRFHVTFVVLYVDSGQVDKQVISPSGTSPWSLKQFVPGSVIHISGPRTPWGQLLELKSATIRFFTGQQQELE